MPEDFTLETQDQDGAIQEAMYRLFGLGIWMASIFERPLRWNLGAPEEVPDVETS